MTLEEFLSLTARRLPTAAELIEVCDSLGIGFGQTGEGKPVLKYGGDQKEEALALVAILRREPWRTQVLAAKGLAAEKPASPSRPEPAPALQGPVVEIHPSGLVRLEGLPGWWRLGAGPRASPCGSCDGRRWSVLLSRGYKRLVCAACVPARAGEEVVGEITLGEGEADA